MNIDALVEIRNAVLGYARVPILRVSQLCIRPGERWFIMGKNGTGKTTLLHAIVGLIRPLNGSVARSLPYKGLEAIGFVPQADETHPVLPMTLAEYIGLGLVGIALRPAQRRARVDDALRRTGLIDLAGESFWTLSGGMRQRALVARALTRNPRLLVMDEPTNGLDPAAEASLMELIHSICRGHGLAAAISTHDVALAAQHADYWALIVDGSLHVVRPRERSAQSLVEQAFGVNPLLSRAL